MVVRMAVMMMRGGVFHDAAMILPLLGARRIVIRQRGRGGGREQGRAGRGDQ